MGIAKISVPVNSPTKYYTNLYDRIPLTYITILLQDNIILCQESSFSIPILSPLEYKTLGSYGGQSKHAKIAS